VTRIAIAAAVNDREILARCLAYSPDIASGRLSLTTYEGYVTAGCAYNQALDELDADWIVFVHQDVYLPSGTLDRLVAAVAELDAKDPEWAVAGVVGKDASGELIGKTWSNRLGRMYIGEALLPAPAVTLDELLLVVRCAAKIRFDADLPSFHLFGTDIVLAAQDAGCSAWAIDLPVVHFSRPVVSLGGGYRAAWHYMRRKWKADLPLDNLVCPITQSPFSIFLTDFWLRKQNYGRRRGGHAAGNPAEIAYRLGFEEPRFGTPR
jgi:hypothetical protein